MLLLVIGFVAGFFFTGSTFKGGTGDILFAYGIVAAFCIAWEGNLCGRITRAVFGILGFFVVWASFCLLPDASKDNRVFWTCLSTATGLGFLIWAIKKNPGSAPS